MTSTSILPRFRIWTQRFVHRRHQHPDLHTLAQHPDRQPRFVRDSLVAKRYLRLLEPLDWTHFPERDLETDWGAPAIPFATFAAACLIKLDQSQVYMSSLRNVLLDHPALVWMLGFPRAFNPRCAHGFDVEASLPTARHLTRMLRTMPNACFQYLLDETVRLLVAELRDVAPDFGRCISLDTKHIIAWVKDLRQPQDFRQGPLRQNQATRWRSRLQAGMQAKTQSTHPSRVTTDPTHRSCLRKYGSGWRVLLGLRIRRGRHQGARLGRVRSC